MPSFLIREFRVEDAAEMARLFNESEEGWPGGLTGGVPYTAERVLEEFERTAAIAHLVAECEGRIVGYLRLARHWLGPDATYVALVNVHPDYRGRGIGTSLLKEAINRSIELGVDRVDLHTWSGNARAIRLYKKLGFYWVPETGVYMQNYLPAIVKLPMARSFFSRHPEALYSFKRELRIEEDDYRVRGRRVYLYEWRAGDEFLKVYVDAYAWGVTGVEWSEGLVECYTGEPLIGRGLPFSVFWHFRNYSSNPLKLTLIPTLDLGVSFKSRPNPLVEVLPRSEKTVSAELVVDPYAKPKPRGEPSRRITSSLIMNGVTFRLVTGFEEKPPLDVKLAKMYSLPLEYSGELLLDVENCLRKRVKARLRLVPGAGVVVKPTSLELELKPREAVTLPVEVGVSRGVKVGSIMAVYDVEVNGSSCRGKPVKLNFTCPALGEVAWFLDEERDRIVVDRGDAWLHILLRGGTVFVYDGDGEQLAYMWCESIGPPFWPNELERARFNFTVERIEGGLRVRLSAPVEKMPGLTFIKELRVWASNPAISIVYEVENSSSIVHEGRLRVNAWPASWRVERLVAPLREGLLKAGVRLGEFPGARGDLPLDPSRYSEGWMCYEIRGGFACGTAWSLREVREVDSSYCRLPSPTYSFRVEPCSRAVIGKLILYAGRGSWRSLRELYWREVERGVRPPAIGAEMKAVEVLTDPMPLIIEGSTSAKARLLIRRSRSKEFRGTLLLRGREVGVEPSRLEVECRGSGLFECEVEFQVAKLEPRAYSIDYTLNSNYGVVRGSIPLIVLGTGGDVLVNHEDDTWIVDNGVLAFRVAAGFAGTLYSARLGEVEQLESPYPKPGQLVWINPWYGGVRVVSRVSRDYLWREEWVAEPVSVGKWRGVKVYTDVRDERNSWIKGLRIEQYYLTRPGSNVIALYTVLENRSRRALEPELFLTAFVKPGGVRAHSMAIRRGGGVEIWRNWGYDMPYIISEEQAVAYNDVAAASLVAGRSGVEVIAMSFGQEHGCHLAVSIAPDNLLKPGEKFELSSYLVLTKRLEEAFRYHALTRLLIQD